MTQQPSEADAILIFQFSFFKPQFFLLLADVRQECHEPRTFDGVLDSPLKRGAIAAPLATEKLALIGTHLLQALHVFVVDESGARAAVARAKSATVLASSSEFLADHEILRVND
jgi:hypothetical protein